LFKKLFFVGSNAYFVLRVFEANSAGSIVKDVHVTCLSFWLLVVRLLSSSYCR